VQTIVRLVQERMRELRAAVDLRRSGDIEGASALLKQPRGEELMNALRTTVGRLEQEQVEKMQKDSRATDEAIRLRTLVFLLAGCGNILFLGWAYRGISQAIEEREATAIMHRSLE
jgi:CHASE3 domain sensor protein